MQDTQTFPPLFLPRAALGELVGILRSEGYDVIAPVEHDGVVTPRPIERAEEMATGLCDVQEPGSYRLTEGDGSMTFEYVLGPDGPKRYLFPPVQRLYQMHVKGEAFVLDAGPPAPRKLAFVGVRPCELAAMEVLDRVFEANDPRTMRCETEGFYEQTRRQALTVAVNCTRPGGTCFCASMGTGPEATTGFDLALTELRDGFVMKVGTLRGQELAKRLSTRKPLPVELELAELKMGRAREHMGRKLDTKGLKESLDKSLENPQWDDVAKRCLSCGNCTMVCPTCFCSTVVDATELSEPGVTRQRQWESCFTHQFSYTTAGPLRNTIRGRYRHWLRHKLCTWWDQFGCSGCVGCGRCITWCPVGIDLTEEVVRVREGQRKTSAAVNGKEGSA